jgi:hypothetical protein
MNSAVRRSISRTSLRLVRGQLGRHRHGVEHFALDQQIVARALDAGDVHQFGLVGRIEFHQPVT